MRKGDVVNMTSWKHWQPTIQASYAAQNGCVGVFLLLGDIEKKLIDKFDPEKALRSMGWIPSTESDEADNLLAVTSLEASEKIAKLEGLLRDIERRILKHQAECLMSNRQAAHVTKIRADIKRALGVIK